MKKAERMQWEKEQKVNRFIQIAQGIFFQKGYDTTTIDEVAQRAGYNKRTLYHYFKDKEELFLAVVLDALKLFNKKLQEAYDNPVEGHTKLYSMGKAFFTFFLEYPHYFNIIMTYEARNCIYYPAQVSNGIGFYKNECQKIADNNTDLILKAIEYGIQEGSIHTTLTPRQLMVILWGQVFGITQIIMMRQTYFKEAFGIDHTELFERFLIHTENSLKNPI
ncbi:MAG TPA: TetR/AcrR family transcriptional regulator [Spirochaetota bacterium]|nr:TetR/AcrR family transcriptional regulator [Spirochaetota bacterium]HOM08900.1 TetR/AcrR family transcriptional regulator [Spirochaetota bacterium]HPP48696.1 TetR/AcrR family transcriptional regulator [Spirochaetota bacterium]